MDPVDLERMRDIPDPFASAVDARAGAAAGAPKGMPPSPSRAARRSARAAAVAAALIYDALWLVLVEHRPDMGVAPRIGIVVGLAVPVAACAVALGGAVRKGGLGLGEPAQRLAALSAVSMAVFVVGTILSKPTDVVAAGGFWGHTLRCMGFTFALAAAPLALGMWAYRHAFVASSRWRGACLGTAAGALAAATMSVMCSTDGVGHVLLGHGIMMAVCAAAGAVFGGRVMRA